jgi:F-type H+-transporting ATPase subunit epsilon
VLRLKRGGEEEEFAIFGGFLQVRPDRVVVLAETADMASEIDIERAERARREAQRVIEGGVLEVADLAAARAALDRALVRLKVAERSGRMQPRREHEGPRRRPAGGGTEPPGE